MVHEHFPDSLTEHCLDVLSVIAPNERELVRIVVEVVIDRRDSVNDVEAETMVSVIPLFAYLLAYFWYRSAVEVSQMLHRVALVMVEKSLQDERKRDTR